MRIDQKLLNHFSAEDEFDPRERSGADVIDLSTRNVLPAVTQRKPRSEGLGLAAGVALVALLGAVTLWTMDSARTVVNSEMQRPQTQIRASSTPSPIPFAPQVPSGAITTLSNTQPGISPQTVLSAPPQAAPSAIPKAQPAPALVFDASALPLPLSSSESQSGTGGDDFGSRIGGVGGTATTATAMVDPKTTVAQGTLIPAVLETAIDTDVPGYTRAVVSADVRSFDGSRVLVPRSSRLIGQYKSGLEAGQKRAYVIWTRLIRPDGVSVNIASPAVGFSGETGLIGRVNSHFFERFGSAMLLSVVGGLSAIGGNAAAIVAGGGQSAAATAVGQNGKIGPTIRVRQGQPIRVFTARDLDFSKVTTE